MTKIKNKETGEWEDVANLTQSDVIRNPDWSRLTAITFSVLKSANGYTVPEDGIVLLQCLMRAANDQSVNTIITINGKNVSTGYDWVGSNGHMDTRFGSISIPVAAGDIIKLTISGTTAADMPGVNIFVPYRVQKSQAESHAVINLQNLTTEGMTIAKWSDPATSIGRFTLPKKGVYFCAIHYTVASTTNQGICIKSPFYSCGHNNNSTIDGTFVVTAPTDNYVLDIKATSNTETPEVVGTFNISGQAIKLY